MIGRITSSALSVGRPAELPRQRDYLTDGTHLYCVEEVFEKHALIEDCRSGVLIDVSHSELLAFALVRSAEAGEGDGDGASGLRL